MVHINCYVEQVKREILDIDIFFLQSNISADRNLCKSKILELEYPRSFLICLVLATVYLLRSIIGHLYLQLDRLDLFQPTQICIWFTQIFSWAVQIFFCPLSSVFGPLKSLVGPSRSILAYSDLQLDRPDLVQPIQICILPTQIFSWTVQIFFCPLRSVFSPLKSLVGPFRSILNYSDQLICIWPAQIYSWPVRISFRLVRPLCGFSQINIWTSQIYFSLLK